jgi:hypothetical protein
VSTALVDHYFKGGGADYDLSSNLGILAEARKQKWKTIEDKYFEELRDKVRAFKCPNVQKFTTFKIQGPKGNGDRSVDYTSMHSGIGKANMNLEYEYVADIQCDCKMESGKVVIYGKAFLNGKYRYDFYDQFRDAADWFNTQSGGDREYTGGKRFNIVGAWEVNQTEMTTDQW